MEPVTLSSPEAEKRIRFLPIIRDFLLIQLLTGMGGFVVGVATGGPERDPTRYQDGLNVATVLLSTLGFTISGVLAHERRWRHLVTVSLLVWLSDIYMVFFGTSVTKWILNIVFVGIMVGLGGAASYLFKRNSSKNA